MTYRKKLIEVALPLEAISKGAAKEKSVHTGHIANLHTWWSRKPLTTSRAVLFASLVDDPGNDLPSDQAEQARDKMLHLLEQIAEWEATNNEELIQKATKEILRSAGGTLPCFVDPFCGGGSIPLEAQRLGLRVHASDLNPVAVLLTKALIEIAPHLISHPPVHPKSQINLEGIKCQDLDGFINDVRSYGEWMQQEAKHMIGALYPPVKLPKQYGGGQAPVVAWLWNRTTICPNPACRGPAPLVNKFWLSTHRGNEAWINPKPGRNSKTITYEVQRGPGNPPKGTVDRSGAKCLFCNEPISFGYIREQGQIGRLSYRLLAIVSDGPKGRIYLPPSEEHTEVAFSAKPEWMLETELPQKALGFRVQRYGMTKHSDLFTSRQLLALTTFSELVQKVHKAVLKDSGNDENYANAVATFLAFSVDRLAQTNNTLVRWLVRKTGTSKGTPALDRQIVSMVWEFAEGNIFGSSVGSWVGALENPLSALKAVPRSSYVGTVNQMDASSAFPIKGTAIVSTDPPYYDNIGYGDLSDFSYIWLRRSLGKIYRELFGTVLVPKKQELTAGSHLFGGDQAKADQHFIEGLQRTFICIRDHVSPEYPLTVYYAYKQTQEKNGLAERENDIAIWSTGWEKILSALNAAGFSITGTWPIRTESANRLRAVGSNALASSIVLVCRPRSEDAPMTTRRDFINLLKYELPKALKTLQQGNIAPVDLAQATIGPGMAVFSRYNKVLEADGTPMKVRSALALINQVLDEYLTEQEGEYDADTRWALAWFEQHGVDEGPYGVAETLSKAKNTAVDALAKTGILVSKAGKVRLLRREELPDDWDPTKDKRLTVWEVTQQLIKRLVDKGSEEAAADLLKKVGGLGETARDLAYRLYTICDRKKWAQEALAYNSLVVAWPELVKLAGRQVAGPQNQEELFERR